MSKKEELYVEIKEVLYSINYIYYGLYFLFFAGIQVFHVALHPFSSGLSRLVYMFYAMGESLIEVVALAFFASWLLKHGKKKMHCLYTVGTLVLFICRVVDFFLVRLMDISIWYGMGFIFEETSTSFVELLHASNVPLAMWILAGLTVCGFFFFGFFFAIFSEKICQKWKVCCSAKKMFSFFVFGCFLLVFSEVFLFFEIDSKQSTEYAKALPWKRTLLCKQENLLTVGHNLKKMTGSQIFLEQADSNLFALERKPDIFLFITESLREDFLTQEVTPSLFAFAKENLEFRQALSVANATHISWFSTFYSMYPFYFGDYQPKKWDRGSHSLSLLKKMGYEIHVYSSSRLNFYQMNQILFGEGENLVDELEEFRLDPTIKSCQADALAMAKLCSEITTSEQKGGRVFIVFLDSSHFGYSWPSEMEPIFSPIDENVNYLKLSYSRKDLGKLKNRYKNSLRYIDELFKSFRISLQSKGLWDESVVIFTGDHAESFNEDGHLFHASALSSAQLRVPLYIKLGNASDSLQVAEDGGASQIDIFPTVFHYLLGENTASSLFQGKSLIHSNHPSYTIGGRYNAGRAPFQFYIQNGEYRIVLEFINRTNIFDCNTLKVCSIEDAQGNEIPFSLSFVHTHFQEALNELFAL